MTTFEPRFRILCIVPTFPKQAEQFVDSRLVAMAERGHEIVVLSGPGDKELPGDVRFRLDGRLRQVTYPRTLAPALVAAARRDPWLTARLVTRVRQRYRGADIADVLVRLLPIAGVDPDVIHFEFVNDLTRYVEVLDLLPGVKVVTSHGSDLRVAPQTNARVRARVGPALRAIDAVHCVSDDLAAIAESFGAEPSKIVSIPTGVDIAFFSTDAYARRRDDGAAGLRLITVARLHWIKGFDYALHAVRELVDRGHDIHYTIVGGDDGGEQAIRLAIRDLDLEGHVELPGYGERARVRALLANADVFVLSSVSEGVNSAALEAMAMSLPVVGTAVGGTPEIVLPGVNGLLVPPRDAAALAAALERLALDPDERRRMGSRAAALVRQGFDRERSVDRMLELYARLVPSGRLMHQPV